MGNAMKNLGIDGVEDCFEYLDRLRKSTITNMFGAAPYLADEMDIPLSDARVILSAWMSTYSDTLPAIDRAATAFEAVK